MSTPRHAAPEPASAPAPDPDDYRGVDLTDRLATIAPDEPRGAAAPADATPAATTAPGALSRKHQRILRETQVLLDSLGNISAEPRYEERALIIQRRLRQLHKDLGLAIPEAGVTPFRPRPLASRSWGARLKGLWKWLTTSPADKK